MTFLRAAAAATFNTLGLNSLAQALGQNGFVTASERLGLDGMLALWQPAATN
jgi:protease-4